MALLEFPAPTHLVGNLLESTELAGEGIATLGRDDIALLRERRIFDLDAHNAPLDLVELVMALEEEFGVEVPEEELKDIRTVGQAFDLVVSKL